MRTLIVGVVVVVGTAVLAAGLSLVIARGSRRTWAREQRRLSLAALVLVAPAAVVMGVLDGRWPGIGGALAWGALAAIAYGSMRLDTDELEGLQSETRWLIDITCLTFAALTVFFSLVDNGWVYLPSAGLLAVATRLAHLRRRRTGRSAAQSA